MTTEIETKPNALDQFRQELAAAWQQMPNKMLFGILFAAWLVLFHFLGNSTLGYVKTPSVFGWLKFVWTTSADDAHGQLIPFVVLALFWWKRKELLAAPKTIWWPALAVVMLGLLLHIGGYMVQQVRVSIVGFFIGLYGLTGLVWGWAWLVRSFFHFALFAFCVPLASVADGITFPLRMLVSKISVAIGHGLGIDVMREGSMLFNRAHTFQYDVAAACSGIRSLIALLALTTIYGFVTFRTTWKRLLMVAIAVPLAVAGNVVRITGVLIVGDTFGQAAGAKFHDGAGFVTFAVAILAVMLLSHWLREEPPADAK